MANQYPELEKYVEIRPVVLKGFPDAQHVFLKITDQEFCVTPRDCETMADAELMRDRLCSALGELLSNHQP